MGKKISFKLIFFLNLEQKTGTGKTSTLYCFSHENWCTQSRINTGWTICLMRWENTEENIKSIQSKNDKDSVNIELTAHAWKEIDAFSHSAKWSEGIKKAY